MGTAFVGDSKPESEPEPDTSAPASAFEEYFTYESLFDEPEVRPSDAFAEDLATLGLEPGVPWSTVVAAHRTLAKLHHPDRQASSSPADVSAAADNFRRINEAYERLVTLRRISQA